MNKIFKITFSFSRFRPSLLRNRFSDILPQKISQFKDIKKKHGDEIVGSLSVNDVFNGLHNFPALFYEGSIIDKKLGILTRGYSLQEIKDFLPKADEIEENQECFEPLPESLIWLILTGDIPNREEFISLQNELKSRSEISNDLLEFIKKMPRDMNPSTQLSNCLLYLQPQSEFVKAYRQGINKAEYWEYYYEDSMNIIAKIPLIAAYIYRHTYKDDQFIHPNPKLDWAGNFAHMLGLTSFEAREFMRGFMTIFNDNSGGNACSHVTCIVGSALGDPYLAYSAGLNSLAGRAYNLYQRQSLLWLLETQKILGDNPTDEKIKDYIIQETGEGRKIPGYSHDELTHIDPRFLHQKAFMERYYKKNPLVHLMKRIYRVTPGVLRTLNKPAKNPWPTVDASNGALFSIVGVNEMEYFTTVFGVARSVGTCCNLVLSRGYALPIERPGSITIDMIKNDPKITRNRV